MKAGRAFGDKRRTPIANLPRLLLFLVFLLVISAPLMAQTPPPYVNVGPGANQAYWTNANTFQGNWGAAPGAFSYSYGINQSATNPVVGGPTTPATSIAFAP